MARKLSDVVSEIEDAIKHRFWGRSFTIKAEIADVKKYHDKKWCFLKFVEKQGNFVSTEIKGIFWSNSYDTILQFEKATGQTFESGLEITCTVIVRFHQRYGLNLEVSEIDFAYTIGVLEMEKQQLIARLQKENILKYEEATGRYFSFNNSLELPLVMQRIAFITAPESDGQRDFKKVLSANKYGLAFKVTEFLTRIQGDAATALILKELDTIAGRADEFDVVVIARGGGSDTDFKAFNNYDLAKRVAEFPIPILTGIGHDRNTSITDMAARQRRTPTEAATFILDHNLIFDRELEQMKSYLATISKQRLDRAKMELNHMRVRLSNLAPEKVLSRGYAIVIQHGKIISEPANIDPNAPIVTQLKTSKITSLITDIQ